MRKTTRHRATKVDPSVDSLLENIVGGRSTLKYPMGANLFSQGDPANFMCFIRTGKVKITVASAGGKKAVLALLGPRDFFGEGCLVVGTCTRTSTATSLEPSTIFRIGKRAMLRAFHIRPKFAEKLLTSVLVSGGSSPFDPKAVSILKDLRATFQRCEYFCQGLLARNVNLEEDLCDQIFNQGEKRLARVLLKLSRFSLNDKSVNIKVPKMNHETLAEIVGTTRSRINLFMNKFRRLGLIDYHKGDADVVIMAELLTDFILADELKRMSPMLPAL